VLYGQDYTAEDRANQLQMTKGALLEHFRFHPQSLLVIEEYDKLDCPTRGLLKQLIDASHSTNVTINRHYPPPLPAHTHTQCLTEAAH